jgi:hypothetical protein
VIEIIRWKLKARPVLIIAYRTEAAAGKAAIDAPHKAAADSLEEIDREAEL